MELHEKLAEKSKKQTISIPFGLLGENGLSLDAVDASRVVQCNKAYAYSSQTTKSFMHGSYTRIVPFYMH